MRISEAQRAYNALTPGQEAVLLAFDQFGKADDTPLTIYVHHVSDVVMSSSGVRTRRAELVRKGLVDVVGTKVLKSGRSAAIHGLTAKGRRVVALAKQPALVV